MDRIQKNTDNVQFIYICEGRRDDPNIALLVFLSEGTLTCHVFWNYSLKSMPKAKRRKGNGINIKNRMAEMGKNWPIPNVPTGNEGPDGELLLRKQ